MQTFGQQLDRAVRVLDELCQLLRDSDAKELYVNSWCQLFLQTRCGSKRGVTPFASRDSFLDWAGFLPAALGVRVDAAIPSGGGEYRDFRWQVVLPPMSGREPLFCLRRHCFGELTLEHFPLGAGLRQQILKSVAAGGTLVFFGATGAGKTSLLMAVIKEVALNLRVLILEEVAELPCLSDRWIRLCAVRPNLTQQGGYDLPSLVPVALRLNPEMLVVGEVRGKEARVLFDAGCLEQGGLLTTAHGSDAATVMARLRHLGQPSRQEEELFLERTLWVHVGAQTISCQKGL